MRGRKPRPNHLKLLENNPGKRRINKGEPKPAGDLFEPPADLPAEAVPFWNQAIADAPAGLLKRLDMRVLVVWTVAAWLHSIAVAKVARVAILIQSRDGNIYQNPALAIVNRQAQIMIKAAAEMGFTPSSRSRINADPNAGGGKEDENDYDEFA
ncbi:MAG: P27 family phage terminase small subunit [Reyranella sp.]|nr:P27 family phage terminase small subunit [Reyranella sp.]